MQVDQEFDTVTVCSDWFHGDRLHSAICGRSHMAWTYRRKAVILANGSVEVWRSQVSMYRRQRTPRCLDESQGGSTLPRRGDEGKMLRIFSTTSSAAMNPAKVVREKVRKFSDLPNIGPAAAKDFELLGFKNPGELKGADPLELYNALSHMTGTYQDACVLDVFMSVTEFLDGNPPKPWWNFTGQRKQRYGDLRIKSKHLSDS